MNNSAETWKGFGKNDPYYGVLSDEKFRNQNLNEEVLDEFFSTGYIYVKEAEDRLFRQFGEKFSGRSILDFGCGVGRLAIPFAKSTGEKVLGIDVSADIIIRAKQHAEETGCSNLEFLAYDGIKLPQTNQFDYVHSYIVLQHIELATGYDIIRQLIDRVKVGGYLQVQATYGHSWPQVKYLHYYLRSTNNIYNYLYSTLKNRKFGAEPMMQMNPYDPGTLFRLFSKYSKSVQVEFTDHTGFLGASYLLRREI
jgi:ubiquinone/menaquinone biosynthesis C-methylase UbiE